MSKRMLTYVDVLVKTFFSDAKWNRKPPCLHIHGSQKDYWKTPLTFIELGVMKNKFVALALRQTSANWPRDEALD